MTAVRFPRKRELVIVNGRYTKGIKFMSRLKPLRAEDNEILYSEDGEPLLPEVDEPRP